MGIDGRFVKFLAQELNEKLHSGRIQKISQISKTDFLFFVRANNRNQKLYYSLSTSLARINLTNHDYPTDFIPGGFCMFLRKYIEGGIIKEIKALNDDRIMEFEVEGKNDLGDSVTLYIIVEMFSRYTNMVILDSDRKIINAYKHISPFDNADRTILNGVSYILPSDERLFQDDLEGIKEIFTPEITSGEIVDSIRGISPLLAKYVVEKAGHNPKKMFSVYSEIVHQEVQPTVMLGNHTDFYYIDLFKSNKSYFDTLSELVDFYYLEASSLERVKQVYKYINNFTKQELKRKKNKLEKLTVDLNNAIHNDILRIQGDVLITNQHLITKGDSMFKGYSYELEKEIEVELDRLLSPVQNANKYYTKYKKQKIAVSYIEKQIKITKVVIIYLDDILVQISNTKNLNDLTEIQEELRSNGFLPRKKVTSKNKKPNFDTYYDETGVLILVGKNNLQNNYLTHKHANRNDWWFHVKDQTGSHVVVSSDADELSEITIRTAANLSACFSKSRNSSSVPVDYTRVKYIKKVPGIFGSFVTYTNQKTIYIDPDMELVEQLKKGR